MIKDIHENRDELDKQYKNIIKTFEDLKKDLRNRLEQISKNYKDNADTATRLVELRIFALLSGHAINLYKDLYRERNKDLYDSYMNIALDFSESGYDRAKLLYAAEKIQEDDKLYRMSINNIVFYLADAATKENINELRKKVSDPLAKLEYIYDKFCKDKIARPYLYKETLVFAHFKFGYENRENTRNAIEILLQNPDIKSDSWKKDISKRYKKCGVLPQTEEEEKIMRGVDITKRLDKLSAEIKEIKKMIPQQT